MSIFRKEASMASNRPSVFHLPYHSKTRRLAESIPGMD